MQKRKSDGVGVMSKHESNEGRSDNDVVDEIKLILLNYSNFSIAKIVVKKIERVKSTLSRQISSYKTIQMS